ncbi:hypothetical protein EVAR_97250_1 [Eumeta japonica]|uniref:Uncharacterized protein n=1 Tax=Eumeta variegata TaxID=151549 RepID=A0A4C1ZF96_EUMVA|nr:hypothetical protein EVAR_97250_1 [Eumeta japonica]
MSCRQLEPQVAMQHCTVDYAVLSCLLPDRFMWLKSRKFVTENDEGLEWQPRNASPKVERSPMWRNDDLSNVVGQLTRAAHPGNLWGFLYPAVDVQGLKREGSRWPNYCNIPFSTQVTTSFFKPHRSLISLFLHISLRNISLILLRDRISNA